MNIELTQTPVNLFTASGIAVGTELVVQNIGQGNAVFSTTGTDKDLVVPPLGFARVLDTATAAFGASYQAAATIVSVRSRADYDKIAPWEPV